MSPTKEESPSTPTGGFEDHQTLTSEESYPIDPIYEARLRGFSEGYAARDREIIRLNAAIDSLYSQIWNPPAKTVENLVAKIDANAARKRMRGAA